MKKWVDHLRAGLAASVFLWAGAAASGPVPVEHFTKCHARERRKLLEPADPDLIG